MSPKEIAPGSDRYTNLSGIDRGLAQVGLRPRRSVYLLAGIAVVIAWAWLVFLAAGVSQSVGSDAVGPGMAPWQGILDRFTVEPSDSGVVAFLLKICVPLAPQGFGLALFLSTFLMWIVMAMAMMLPSAAPMIRTYADIADVAAQKGEQVVPLVILVLGYVSVWVGFAFTVSLLQLLLIRFGVTADPVFPVQGILAGSILVIAGLYQFSSLKNACLEKCRNPFSVLFGRWSDKTRGIYKLGVEQGLYCLGCCWALMLVMLAVGTMNLAWMAFFTLLAIVEKTGKGKVTSSLFGGILLLWGGLLILVDFA
jgi:predicted metal-binding membrane protein